MKGEPLKLASDSSATMEHLTGKRGLSARLAEDKSCNSHNANKRMKHHQERQFGNSTRVSGLTPSPSSSDDESGDNLSPFNLARPTTRNTNAGKSCSRENENQPKLKQVNNNNKLDFVNEYRKTMPVDHGDNSSSTSDCSCEQHSNHEEDDEDFREKLDYDEDSSTKSPSGSSSSNNNNNNNDNTRLPVSSSERSSSATAIVSEENVSSLKSKTGDKQERQQTTTPKTNELPSSSADLRLKSVINLNHRPSATELDNSARISVSKTSPRSYHSLLKYLFKDACFFQMKSINHENIKISKSSGIWSTPIPNELRLNLAFREHRNVILIFSVQQSGGFQGFARMVSESKPATRPLPWILPERLSSKALRGVFKVQWICKKELPFHIAHDLYNPYNDNKPIKVARDGQQVESRTGKKLCKLFPEDDRDRLLDSVSLMKHQTSQRKKYPHRYEYESNPYSYKPGPDAWRRDAFHPDNSFQHQHQHHYDDEQHRRSNEQPNFNYRNFEPHNPPCFYNNLPRQPPGQYHQPHYHQPPLDPLPYQLPMDEFLPQDIWGAKPVMLRHHSRDHRTRR